MGGRGASSSQGIEKKPYAQRRREFNDFRFGGLNAKRISNHYITMDRISKDGNKLVINFGDAHLKQTRYGYALILDKDNVVFLKNWQVNKNYYANEVLLNKEYFKPKKWGNHEGLFSEIKENLNWSHWQKVAKAQQANKKNPVNWRLLK